MCVFGSFYELIQQVLHEFTVSATSVVNCEGSFPSLFFPYLCHPLAVSGFGDKFHASQLTSKMSYRVFSPAKLCTVTLGKSCLDTPRSWSIRPLDAWRTTLSDIKELFFSESDRCLHVFLCFFLSYIKLYKLYAYYSLYLMQPS